MLCMCTSCVRLCGTVFVRHSAMVFACGVCVCVCVCVCAYVCVCQHAASVSSPFATHSNRCTN